MKENFICPDATFPEQNKSRRERRVSAQINLNRRREPAQLEAIATRHGEGRLRQIIIRRDALQDEVGQPRVEWTNSSGITTKWIGGKSRDFVVGEFHFRNIDHCSACYDI